MGSDPRRERAEWDKELRKAQVAIHIREGEKKRAERKERKGGK